MGCSSNKIEHKSGKRTLLKKVKEKVLLLIEKNPFYNISLKEFKKYIKKDLKDEFNQKIEIITSKIINTFIKDDNEFNYIFLNVTTFAYSKFQNIFPDNEELKKLILYFIFLFLTENQREINGFFYKQINKLFDKIKIKENEGEEGNIYFGTGTFSFLLLNIIQFGTFCFISFFCSLGVLEVTGDFKKYEIKRIFSSEYKSSKYHPNNINKLLNDYLYYINHNIQPKIINTMILTDVLQPISDYILDNKDEKIFSISKDKLKEILYILISKMNHNSFLKLFFNENDNINEI